VLPVAAALREIPGVGPVTATAVAACLTTKRFDHPDRFVAYIGLDTRVRDSGQRTGRRYKGARVHRQSSTRTGDRAIESSNDRSPDAYPPVI
jgi:transposase